MLADAHWMKLEPLIETCRPKGKTPPQDLRRTISAIVWRHQNGAKWRAIPAELGPWSRAAQTFIRWAHLGVWERLLLLAQERGVQLGMTLASRPEEFHLRPLTERCGSLSAHTAPTKQPVGIRAVQ
jgi:transposase